MQQTKGAIGYVEYAYAIQNHLVYADMINVEGKKVAPSMASFQAAAADADFSKTQNFYLILTNQPSAKSWPFTAPTYMPMRKDAPPADIWRFSPSSTGRCTRAQAQAKQLD